MTPFDSITEKNIALWLEGPIEESIKEEVRLLRKNNPKDLIDSFYMTITFGTGGLRGLMGVGTNRMNIYTIRAATQGLANVLIKTNVKNSVCIGYDSRHHSQEFALEAARVLAANGIEVFLSSELRPTPWVSFGCRLKKCTSALMITASHNPPQYNGYKVYWSDGGQVVPPYDKEITAAVHQITDFDSIKYTLDSPLIKFVDQEIDEPYLQSVSRHQNYSTQNKEHGKDLKIVYTSLHGTGITLFPAALHTWGFTNITFVDSQIIPHGDFPTVAFPNPEDPHALKLGIEKMLKEESDLLLATDPDADRVGLVVRHEGKPFIFNGNQIACICIEHLCRTLTTQNRMPPRGAFIKSIGTTELFRVIAESYGKKCYDVLTGFKYIAEKIHQWEQEPGGEQFLFGGEESFGYLLGTDVRDKDAILASALIAEAALTMKLQGKTLVDLLYTLYRKYGYYYETLKSLDFPDTKEGRLNMELLVSKFENNPPKEIAGIEVLFIENYETSLRNDIKTGKTTHLTLPKSKALLFWLADGSKLMIRPSGTEPKVKIYCGVVIKDFTSIDEASTLATKKAYNLCNL